MFFARFESLLSVEFVPEDETEAPAYEHPEVYWEFESWEVRKSQAGPLIEARCAETLQQTPLADLVRQATHGRIRFATRHLWWAVESWEDVQSIHELELEADQKLPPNRIIAAGDGDFEKVVYFNISAADLIEVPLNRYLRLVSDPD